MYEGIKETVYRLFPDVIYDNGVARHYNVNLGYNTSRQLIRLVAAHKDEHDYNDTIKQLKLQYDGSSNMEVDEINLLYYLMVDLEVETHTAVCECCGRVFDYDSAEVLREIYYKMNVQIPTICVGCAEEEI